MASKLKREEEEKASILETENTLGEDDYDDDKNSDKDTSPELRGIGPNGSTVTKTTNNTTQKTEADKQGFGQKMWRCQICTFEENPYAVPVCIVKKLLAGLSVDLFTEEVAPPSSETPISHEESNIDDYFEPNFLRQHTVHMQQQLETELQKVIVEKKERESALEATLVDHLFFFFKKKRDCSKKFF
ncbi:hypothetical protein RFI_13255 [Reticulomyxa filosa]|uniref:Uncharacterized protein n=1 Tax=Reticulomyxa filosa TaxID=46433 RepID=X6NDV2_RETFI|nr:hypothetical protein RFI_13255 [Reticulomyxa filosa]|eukprot:ETO23904.1 hypothetical protein RFI_13255 [Reticulomyxa filosa]